MRLSLNHMPDQPRRQRGSASGKVPGGDIGGGGENVAQHILMSSAVTHTINLPSSMPTLGRTMQLPSSFLHSMSIA